MGWRNRTGERAQQLKVLGAKTDDLSSTSRNHLVGKN